MSHPDSSHHEGPLAAHSGSHIGLAYVGFILIMLGFLLQWPTLPTIMMFPILVYMYARLAHREEREVTAEFGDAYVRYSKIKPAFLPKSFRHGDSSSIYGRHRH